MPMGGTDSAIRMEGLSGSSEAQSQAARRHRWPVSGREPRSTFAE